MTDQHADTGDTDPAENTAEDSEDEEGDAEDARDTTPRCSAKGCGARAVWAVRWHNPKIHEPGRRKIWLACDAHRDHLDDFLGRRGFPRDVVPIEDLR